MNELCHLSARSAVRRLSDGEISPHDLIDAAMQRLAVVEPAVNAVPTIVEERARRQADRILRKEITPPGDGRGWLAGLPIVVKDLHDVEGVRTTYGCTAFENHVPNRSVYDVERMEAHGAIILGKSNTPEFGAGGQTFNSVFGVTRNPWNTARTCGGSSGGAAVALATGEVWLADGSDLGGSLRGPASFCSVVGLRPSPGRVAIGPSSSPFQTLSVHGPMARDVRDCALFLDTLAGFDPRDPISIEAPRVPFAEAVEQAFEIKKVAFSPDLNGITPVKSEVVELCRRAAARMSALGCEVVDPYAPDLSDAQSCFATLRAEMFATSRAPLLEQHRDKLKPELIWNIELGLVLTGQAIGLAERQRAQMVQAMAGFFEEYDLLLCPTCILPPFSVEQRFISEIDGHEFPSYIDWVAITYAISLTGCPCISLPCGFTQDGLPVGIQIVGPPRAEAKVLAAAAQLEDVLGLAQQLPIDPRDGVG